MKRINMDREWSFTRARPNFAGMGGEPPVTVHLPHDFSIALDTRPDSPGGTGNAYYDGGTGYYDKTLELPAEYAGKRLLLEVGGAYMNAAVSLNGQMITHHHYGYTSFHADLTPYAKPGKENRLSVTVSNAQPNTRWYSGSGLYRSVYLLVGEQTHIAPWGIYARLDHIVGDTAFVLVEVTVENHAAEKKNLWVDVTFSRDGETAGKSRAKVFLPAGESASARTLVAVEHYAAWDLDAPNLYTVTAELTDGEAVLDIDSTVFGIRTLSADAKNGLLINGRSVKLKGGCIHHDNGLLGAAAFRDSEYRRLKAMQDAGYNAIRCAHNPPSEELLAVCDEIGMLVMDEAFDCWATGKNMNDYGQYFTEDWAKDIRSMVVRDRNHPSIIMWSIGNEIFERDGSADGYRWAYRLAEKVREYDDTRLVTNGICGIVNVPDNDEINRKLRAEMIEARKNSDTFFAPNEKLPYANEIWGQYTESFAAMLDVVGYNYMEDRYDREPESFPDRLIVGTESHPDAIDYIWDRVERLPYVLGDFVWAGYDYIGETGVGLVYYVDPNGDQRHKGMPWPTRLANVGDFDVCAYGRPQLAYRRIVWGSGETWIASRDPKHHGLKEIRTNWGWPICDNSWTWTGSEGGPVTVEVYSAAEEVELILNGESLGRKPAGKANRYKAAFETVYQPGVLEAVSYTDGKEVSRDKVETVGAPAALRLTLTRTEMPADGHALAYAEIEVVDAQGRRVPGAELKAEAAVEGAATLAAFGNGNPVTTENYTAGAFTSYHGRLLAILRAGYAPGEATLTVRAEGLPEVRGAVTVGEYHE